METATLPYEPFSSAASAAASSASSISATPSRLQSSSERYFLSNAVSCDIRSDGRSRLDYRYFQLRTAVIAHCAGSARMTVEGSDVIVAVTADITPTEWSRPEEGIVQCSVELAAALSSSGGSSPTIAIEVKAALESLFVRSRSLDTRQLCILRGEQCWTLYVDVLVLSADGNLIDAAALATKAALVSTSLPAVAVSTAAVDSQQPIEVTLTDEPPTRLQSTERLPVAVTLHSFNQSTHFVLDARAEEEAAAEWRLTVGVAEDGSLVYVEKGGRRAATQSMVREMMAAARKIGVDLNRLVRKISQPENNSGSGQTDMQIK